MSTKQPKPTKKRAVTNKTTTKAAAEPSQARTGARKLKTNNKYASFRLQKRIKVDSSGVTGSFRLFAHALKVLAHHKKLFGGIAAIYFLLTIVLVRGLGSSIDVPVMKRFFQEQGSDTVSSGVQLIGLLFGAIGEPATAAGTAYQSMLLAIISLVTIWALRQVLADKVVSVRDAFYKGLYPLVPFLLVLLVVGLQLLPMFAGALAYSYVLVGNQLVLSGLEVVLMIALIFLLVVWSLYMVTASIMALYIVTLPDMRPLQALRSAKQLVQHRRWLVMRKMLFLPFVLLVLGAVIMLPVVLLLTAVAEWIFYALNMVALLVAHTYIYSLYRKLL